MAPSFSCYKVGITTLAILIVFLSSSSADIIPRSCPKVFEIVKTVVANAIIKEARMGASLLRLHFHDCFVNGCDGSILLDDTPTFTGEKTAAPNNNSLRGFEVVDSIKEALEATCPGVVSCADILAIAARDSVVQLGGRHWDVGLGRGDARTASQGAANKSLPTPTMDLSVLVSTFQNVGLNLQDLIVLSGAHTIGQARCTNFRNRIYNENRTIDSAFAKERQDNCPSASGSGDDNLADLDLRSPKQFDNSYYANILIQKGLLHSDQQLSGVNKSTAPNVQKYSMNPVAFQADFGAAMVRMGRIPPSKGAKLEIRRNCRMVNTN